MPFVVASLSIGMITPCKFQTGAHEEVFGLGTVMTEYADRHGEDLSTLKWCRSNICVFLHSISFIVLLKLCNDFFANGWFRKSLILEREEIDGNREIVVSCFFESEIMSLFDKTGLQLYSRGESFLL